MNWILSLQCCTSPNSIILQQQLMVSSVISIGETQMMFTFALRWNILVIWVLSFSRNPAGVYTGWEGMWIQQCFPDSMVSYSDSYRDWICFILSFLSFRFSWILTLVFLLSKIPFTQLEILCLHSLINIVFLYSFHIILDLSNLMIISTASLCLAGPLGILLMFLNFFFSETEPIIQSWISLTDILRRLQLYRTALRPSMNARLMLNFLRWDSMNLKTCNSDPHIYMFRFLYQRNSRVSVFIRQFLNSMWIIQEKRGWGGFTTYQLGWTSRAELFIAVIAQPSLSIIRGDTFLMLLGNEGIISSLFYLIILGSQSYSWISTQSQEWITAPLLWKGAYPHSKATLISTSLLIIPLFIRFSKPCLSSETGTGLGSVKGLFLTSFGRIQGFFPWNLGLVYLYLPMDLPAFAPFFPSPPFSLSHTFSPPFSFSLSPLILGRWQSTIFSSILLMILCFGTKVPGFCRDSIMDIDLVFLSFSGLMEHAFLLSSRFQTSMLDMLITLLAISSTFFSSLFSYLERSQYRSAFVQDALQLIIILSNKIIALYSLLGLERLKRVIGWVIVEIMGNMEQVLNAI